MHQEHSEQHARRALRYCAPKSTSAHTNALGTHAPESTLHTGTQEHLHQALWYTCTQEHFCTLHPMHLLAHMQRSTGTCTKRLAHMHSKSTGSHAPEHFTHAPKSTCTPPKLAHGAPKSTLITSASDITTHSHAPKSTLHTCTQEHTCTCTRAPMHMHKTFYCTQIQL
ncbi:putative uncharacterized protein FLJ46204 [Homarus americanus]|uniref:putative uncharacterized protein FLJ46204 n=1 Tax=Homarus americanus TaxID=6706 RepID=UPI001C438A3B|nr:putative uncharacterized protein FLJ46204 [Homarus americanus]